MKPEIEEALHEARTQKAGLASDPHEGVAAAHYSEAEKICSKVLDRSGTKGRFSWEARLDRLVTSKMWGFPLMILLLIFVFWITITGANIPSAFLSDILIGNIHRWLKDIFSSLGVPFWIDGLLLDGMYLATAWVIAVMLPPMAIFFPLFTLLEDLGYLPRVAFNLDSMFRKSGAHGKQALSHVMGFGCNAAGIVATRIIDSPRERLIAILTNNFALCNGRWPTQILVATLFLGTLVPSAFSGLISAGAVVAVALLGMGFTFLTAKVLSKTLLKGTPSTFSLELPPYRPPRVWRVLWSSFIDRTVLVLWRAVVFALPAGAIIWLIANVQVAGQPVAFYLNGWLDPLGILIGLNGVILLAYLVAIPANEIVVPTILMITLLLTGSSEGAGVMIAAGADTGTMSILALGGWTPLTAVSLMLFSLLHNPCSTTLVTIKQETGSWKWAAVAALIPLVLGFTLCFLVAQVWRLFT